MQLLELPLELVEDIINEVVWNGVAKRITIRSGKLYFICRLREVNKLFESIITTEVADHWLCMLTKKELERIPKPFMARLISIFVGTQNRRLNKLHSHLHATVDHLAMTNLATPRITWLQRVEQALNICAMSDARFHPLRSDGGYYRHLPWSGYVRVASRSFKTKRYYADYHCQLSPDILATVFMLAVIRDDGESQDSILAQGFHPDTPCFYFGHALLMAARLGYVQTVARLLAAGAQLHQEASYPDILCQAVSAGHADVVKLLLSSSAYHGTLRLNHFVIAEVASTQNDRPVLEQLLAFGKRGAYDLQAAETKAIEAAARNGWDDLLQRILESEMAGRRHSIIEDALKQAVRGGSLSSCQILLEYIEAERIDCGHFCRAAAYGGNVQVLELFIHNDIKAECHHDILGSAAMRGHVEMLRYALDNRFHETCENPSKLICYALVAAIYNNSLDTVEYLVRYLSINLNKCLLQQNTYQIDPHIRREHDIQEGVIEINSLTVAIDIGSPEMVLLLKQLGASATRVNLGPAGFSRHSRCQRWKALRYGVQFAHMIRLWKDWTYDIAPGKVDQALRVALL